MEEQGKVAFIANGTSIMRKSCGQDLAATIVSFTGAYHYSHVKIAQRDRGLGDGNFSEVSLPYLGTHVARIPTAATSEDLHVDLGLSGEFGAVADTGRHQRLFGRLCKEVIICRGSFDGVVRFNEGSILCSYPSLLTRVGSLRSFMCEFSLQRGAPSSPSLDVKGQQTTVSRCSSGVYSFERR